MTKKTIIRDMAQIEKVIRSAKVIQLAFCSDNRPYLLPISFGYRDGVLYFHSKKSGKKLDIMAANEQVAFSLLQDVQLLENNNPCGYSFKYASVSGWGNASIIEDFEEKQKAISILARQYCSQLITCPEENYSQITVIKLVIEEVTLKTSLPE